MKFNDWFERLALSAGWLDGDLLEFISPEKVLLFEFGGRNCWGGR